MQTEINVVDGKIIITGPYSEDNNEDYRSLGGKFSGGSWVLPDNATVREKIACWFGSKSEEVEALVPSSKTFGSQIVQIGGYVLASRRGRDYGVKMPDGVSLESGSFSASGGSVKNPRVGDMSDVVFRLRCRKSFAESKGLEICKTKQSTIEI